MKAWYPCTKCAHRPYCEMVRGCDHWKAWFRAYWSQLRDKYCRSDLAADRNLIDRLRLHISAAQEAGLDRDSTGDLRLMAAAADRLEQLGRYRMAEKETPLQSAEFLRKG